MLRLDPQDWKVHIRRRPDDAIAKPAKCGKTGQTTITAAWGYWGPGGGGHPEVCKDCIAEGKKDR